MQGGHKNVFQMCNCRQDINPLKTTQHDWQGLKGQLCCNTLYTLSDVFNTRKFAFFCDEKVSFRRRDNSDVVSCWQWIRQHERYVLTSGASRPIDSRNKHQQSSKIWTCTTHGHGLFWSLTLLKMHMPPQPHSLQGFSSVGVFLCRRFRIVYFWISFQTVFKRDLSYVTDICLNHTQEKTFMWCTSL